MQGYKKQGSSSDAKLFVPCVNASVVKIIVANLITTELRDYPLLLQYFKIQQCGSLMVENRTSIFLQQYWHFFIELFDCLEFSTGHY